MTKIYAIANQKGGVGKSTTANCLAAGISEQGKRVLIVDLDPHGGVTTLSGFDFRSFTTTSYDFVSRPREVDFKTLVVSTSVPGVFLIPANSKLALIEGELSGEIGWERFLKDAIAFLPNPYDYILLDCPPTLGFLTINALMAAHQLIVPVQTEFLALRALVEFNTILDKVKARGNPDLVVRVLGTMFDGRTTHATAAVEELRKVYGRQMFTTLIKRTVRFADASVAGQSVLSYAPQSEGAEAYRTLTKEILSI